MDVLEQLRAMQNSKAAKVGQELEQWHELKRRAGLELNELCAEHERLVLNIHEHGSHIRLVQRRIEELERERARWRRLERALGGAEASELRRQQLEYEARRHQLSRLSNELAALQARIQTIRERVLALASVLGVAPPPLDEQAPYFCFRLIPPPSRTDFQAARESLKAQESQGRGRRR